MEADVQSRSGHENKSCRNSQKLGRRPERTRDKDIELINLKKRVNLADNMVVSNSMPIHYVLI